MESGLGSDSSDERELIEELSEPGEVAVSIVAIRSAVIFWPTEVVDVIANAMGTVRVVGDPASIPVPDAGRARESDSCHRQDSNGAVPADGPAWAICASSTVLLDVKPARRLEITWPSSFCNIGHHWPLARIMNYRLRYVIADEAPLLQERSSDQEAKGTLPSTK